MTCDAPSSGLSRCDRSSPRTPAVRGSAKETAPFVCRKPTPTQRSSWSEACGRTVPGRRMNPHAETPLERPSVLTAMMFVSARGVDRYQQSVAGKID